MIKLNHYWMAALLVGTLGFSGDGKFGGLVFYDYTHETEDGAINGFGLHRVYFTYQQEISDGIKYKFQTDIDYKSSPMNVYLKNAKVDWKSPVGKLTFGLQGMNVFNVQEKTWGYRFMEKSPMDRKKWASSADMGVGYSNTFVNKLHLSLLATNGTGYKKSESDSYKKLSAQLVYGVKKLVKKDGLNVGGVFTYEPYDFEVDSISAEKKTKTVLGLFGGYAGKGIRAGVEWERFTDAGSDKTKQLVAAYAKYIFSNNIEVLGRYDLYDPDLGTEKNGESYLIAGVSYSPGKGLVIVPNIRYTAFEDDTKDNHTGYKVNFEFKF